MSKRKTLHELARLMRETDIPFGSIARLLMKLGFDEQRVKKTVRDLQGSDGNQKRGIEDSRLSSIEVRLDHLEKMVLKWTKEESSESLDRIFSRVRALEAKVEGLTDALTKYLPYVIDREWRQLAE